MTAMFEDDLHIFQILHSNITKPDKHLNPRHTQIIIEKSTFNDPCGEKVLKRLYYSLISVNKFILREAVVNL